MISEHAIRTYLASAEGRGWHPVARGSLAAGWRLAYQGKLVTYDAYLDVEGDWVYLQCPALKQEPSKACREILLDYLLRLNDRMFWAKFTLIQARPAKKDTNWVVLVAECPAEVFDAGMFRLMTEAVAGYADQYFREIQALAVEEEVAKLAAEIGFPPPQDVG